MDKVKSYRRNVLFLKIVFLLGSCFGNCQHIETQKLSLQKYKHLQFKIQENNNLFQEQSQIFRKLLHNDSQQKFQNSSFLQSYLKYEEVVQKIYELDASVQSTFEQLNNTKLLAKQNIQELLNEKNIFDKITQELEILNILDSFEEISKLRTRFIEASKNLQKATDKFEQFTLLLQEQQKLFEEELTNLQNQEKNLIKIANEFQSAGLDLFMVTNFNITNNFFSSKYLPQQKNISENQLNSLLNTGLVGNIAVNLTESSEIYKNINLTGEVKIQELQIINSKKNGIKYLRLNFLDENSSLIFEDSKFYDVGLRIDGLKNQNNLNNNNVEIKNFEIKNAPNSGIWIKNCNNFLIEKSTILNSGVDGIEIDQVYNSTIDNIIVKDSKSDGIEFRNNQAYIQNSSVQNSLHFGVLVDSGIVIAQNVTFSGNVYGNASGNYISD